ncbi:class I adenylate-forming enzyme family protein [Rhodococcus sp. NPDC003318]|uniref:class I adenylate-forming enzyme family protein n=1 Tax=Rhodococcus sp. NPDC003318 TaxID=3364503 RepID=UPI0036A30C1F
MSITAAVRRAASLAGSNPAYRDGDTWVTWQGSVTRISALAAALRERGVQPGSRVATLAGNAPRHLEVLYAIWWAGGVIVPINTRLAVDEIRYMLDHSGTALIVTDGDSRGSGEAAVRAAAGDPVLVDYDDAALWSEMIATQPIPDAYPAEDATAGIFYTGGTTGTPKGVELTHTNFLFAAMGTHREVRLDSDSVYQHSAPLFHMADFCLGNGVTLAAGTHSFLPKFSPQNFYEGMRADGVTHICLVPTMLASVLDAPTRDEELLSRVRSITYGAAPIATALLERVVATFPNASLQQFYGMTESCGASTVLPPESHHTGSPQLDSAGRPFLGCEIRVVDGNLDDVPHGTSGEILMRGPNVMRGYWHDPDRTAEVLADGGWLRSGDIGVLGDDGFLSVVDRLKDMIVTGGENVYSGEVEGALATHPDVAQCAVVGVPDDLWGERVHAVVVLRPGATAAAGELEAHLRERIAGYKVPKSFELERSELPVTAVGKIRKNVLREEWMVKNA